MTKFTQSTKVKALDHRPNTSTLDGGLTASDADLALNPSGRTDSNRPRKVRLW